MSLEVPKLHLPGRAASLHPGRWRCSSGKGRALLPRCAGRGRCVSLRPPTENEHTFNRKAARVAPSPRTNHKGRTLAWFPEFSHRQGRTNPTVAAIQGWDSSTEFRHDCASCSCVVMDGEGSRLRDFAPEARQKTGCPISDV